MIFEDLAETVTGSNEKLTTIYLENNSCVSPFTSWRTQIFKLHFSIAFASMLGHLF